MEIKRLFALTLVLLLYLCVGAGVFQAMESSGEQESVKGMVEEYRKFLDNHPCVSSKNLTGFIEAVLSKVGPYGAFSRAKFDANLTRTMSRDKWDFPGAFVFSVTVITTIGYGHIYPVSPFGRLWCVLYALFGIPLTLIVLSGIGDHLNKIGRRIMKLKLCNKALNMVGVVMAGIVVLFVLPTVVFAFVEGWDILKGLYYCFITLSTIGFGDYVAGNSDDIENGTSRNIYRIVVYMWILIGLSYISLIIKALSDLFIKKAEEVEEGAVRIAVQSGLVATLSTLSTVSSSFAGSPDFMEATTESISSQMDSGDTTTSAGPTMTYRKHGLTRFMVGGDEHKASDVKLVGISFIKTDTDTPANDEGRPGIRDNNNIKDKKEENHTGDPSIGSGEERT